MRRKLCWVALCAAPFVNQVAYCQSQQADSTAVQKNAEAAAADDTQKEDISLSTAVDSLVSDIKTPVKPKSMSVRAFAIPIGMIAYGACAFTNKPMKRINLIAREEVWEDRRNANGVAGKTTIDNYTIYAPAVAVYALNLAGVKGKNNFVDRSIMYGMSSLIANGLVFSTKGMTGVVRPDSSNSYSFPSGHTAMAFVSAEFLRQEYKDVSPWIGAAGYAVAAGTGFLRMYNNKHWFNDVIAGAGVGILSVRLSYWLYPKLKNTILKGTGNKTVVMPTYQNGAFGVGLVQKF